MAYPPGRCARFLSAPACLYRRIILLWPARIRGRAFVLYWLTGRAGRSGLSSRFLPARIGMRAPMAAGCGGHRMEPVEACWTRATSMDGWWCMLRRRGRRLSSSRCRRTNPGNGSKASRRTPCSSTSRVVRCALIPESASTRWSSPMHILPAAASRRDFFPVVYGPLPFPCLRNLDRLAQRVWVPQQPSGRSAGSYQ